MPAPVIEFRDGADVLVSAGSFFDFGTVVPGSPTPAVVRNVHNGFGLTGGAAVDTALNIVITVQARLTATGGQWLGDGIGLLESLAIELQFPNIPELAGFFGVGSGVPVSLPDLETDSQHDMNVRANLPAGAVEVGVQFKIAVDFQRTQALPGGIFVHQPGISRGVGRGVGTAVFSRDQPFEVSGTGAGSTLRWPTYAWYTDGRPTQELGGNATSGDEVLDNLDKSASALAAGEAYGFRTVLTATGRLVEKSDKITGTPAFPADYDAASIGSIAVGHGIRFADADALAPEHTELVDATPKFCDVVTSGLNYIVAPVGVSAIVHGRLNTNKTENSGVFPGDGTHTVWLLPDGSVDDTVGPDGATPQVGAIRLADVVIAGSVETARVNYRPWLGSSRAIQFSYEGSGTGAVTRLLVNSISQRLWIRPESVFVRSTDGTGGNVVVDIFLETALGAPVSIFVSQGTDDRRPTLASPAESSFGVPETLLILPAQMVVVVATFTAPVNGDVVVSFVVDVE